MKILNASYAVLSDPARRRKHDEWIRAAEAASRPQPERQSGPPPGGGERADGSYGATAAKANAQSGNERTPRSTHGMRAGGAAGGTARGGRSMWIVNAVTVAALIALGVYVTSGPPEPSGLPPYEQNAATEEDASVSVQPFNEVFGPQSDASNSSGDAAPLEGSGTIATAPNGSPWPEAAGYVTGYPRLQTSGHSTVTVDNSSNSSDVFVKLVQISPDKTRPIRHIYIPKYETFKMGSVPPGSYDVRYMDLSDGSLARSESFELEQNETDTGISFSNITMTLYKVANGNMQTYPLSPSEF